LLLQIVIILLIGVIYMNKCSENDKGQIPLVRSIPVIC